jgi:hypothetical protein
MGILVQSLQGLWIAPVKNEFGAFPDSVSISSNEIFVPWFATGMPVVLSYPGRSSFGAYALKCDEQVGDASSRLRPAKPCIEADLFSLKRIK